MKIENDHFVWLLNDEFTAESFRGESRFILRGTLIIKATKEKIPVMIVQSVDMTRDELKEMMQEIQSGLHQNDTGWMKEAGCT